MQFDFREHGRETLGYVHVQDDVQADDPPDWGNVHNLRVEFVVPIMFSEFEVL